MPKPQPHRILTLRLTPEEDAQLTAAAGIELTDKHEYIHAAITAQVRLDLKRMQRERIAREIADGR